MMFSTQDIVLHIADLNPEAILWDGFNDCIVGVTEKGIVVYETSLMIAKLMRADEMTPEDALEYLQFNTWNTFVGEFTPIHIQLFDVEAFHMAKDGEGYPHM
tara:strand:+ start:1773 stop:2078 length:306 start_codon:yes stop_codon:yes gene_type:complete